MAVLLIQPRAPDYNPHHDSTDDEGIHLGWWVRQVAGRLPWAGWC